MLSASWQGFFDWCGNTWLGTTVRDVTWAFPLIETFHLLAMAVLLGSVLIVNLRVFGIGARGASPAEAARDFEPWLLTSLAVLIATGIPMFCSETMKCYESYSFPIKMALILLGIFSQFTIYRKWILKGDPKTGRAKAAASLSIVIWIAVGVAGKAIPYI